MSMAAGVTRRRRRPQLSVLFCVVVLAAAATAAQASNNSNVTSESDEEYWAERAEAARSRNRAAYVSDPVAAMNRFNADVLRSTTRRALARYEGPCVATNPIDRCWRCRADWANDRRRLAQCARGFGHKTVGGARGKLYVVRDPSDDEMLIPRKGTLRHAVIQDRPLWIVFARDMIIKLRQELIVSSNKTLDGRGAQVHVVGAQITLQSVHDVILHNLHVHDAAPHSGGMIRDSKRHTGMRSRSDGDGVSVLSSSNVWIDHVSMSSCADGLIDVVSGSTAITISNSHFTRHDHVMLFGASNGDAQDKEMQITVAFNHFGRGLVQRMPRCRFGFFHVVNNDYTHWLMYAIGGNMNPTIIRQGNRFIAPDDPNAKEVTKREYTAYKDYKEWVWKSQGDVMMNGAFFNESGGQNERKNDEFDFIPAKHGRYVGQLTRFAGPLKCTVGQPC